MCGGLLNLGDIDEGSWEDQGIGLFRQPLTEINADQENQEKHDIWKELGKKSGHQKEYDDVQYKLTHFRFFLRHCVSFWLLEKKKPLDRGDGQRA